MLFVLLNAKRMPNRKGPRVGAVEPFITHESGAAAGFTRSDAKELRSFGLAIPAVLARLVGWRVHRMG